MPQRAAIPFVRFDPRARGTLQLKIYSAIRAAIVNGAFPPGTRLLSSRALADELGVSRTTTLLALEQLLAEGYLTTRHGSGTFVASELPDEPPRGPARPEPSLPRHPPLSRRGETLVTSRPPGRWIQGPPRPFRIGTPALDVFPTRVWSQLVNRRQKSSRRRSSDTARPLRCARRSPNTSTGRAARVASPTRCSWWPERSAAWT